MTYKEFRERCKRNPPQEEIDRRRREAEKQEDEYYERLGELVEEHPIRRPRIFRG